MPSLSFLVRVVTAGTIATIAGAMPVSAQESGERGGCFVAPREVEELVGFYFDENGELRELDDLPSVDTEAQLPAGEPVDALTEAEVNAVFTELAACIEQEQFVRVFALMTDDLARQLGPGLGDSSSDTPREVRATLEAQLAATPQAAPAGDGFEFGPGRDLRLLDDGRVGGVWTVDEDAAFVVFEQQGDDTWLVDELIDIVEDD